MESTDISEEDVLKCLNKLKPSKSPGPDGLHPRVLKEAAEIIAKPLSIIFNKSIEQGTVPDDWKLAHVTALFKKGKATSPGNYRPVSLTSVVCKIMESILRDQIMQFLDDNTLLSEHQHGFRSGRSCVTQLIEVLDTWTSMIDEEGGVDVAYLDFSKAFDSVPHQRLLKKLKAHGINGNMLKWIESFLSNRKQCVVVNGTKSSWTKVLSGIPQGSVLGPILFVVYINDLPDDLKGHVKMFADDTKVYSHIRNNDDCELLQNDLDSLSNWSEKWQLKFNVGKCGIMHYGHQREEFTYSMREGQDRANLNVRKEEKDLGVVFDPTLKFSNHVGKVANKANSILGLIKRTFTYMDVDMFIPLYKTLVRPHLEYANCVWSPFLRKDITRLEKVQRRATKIIPALADLPYIERQKELNLPALAYRRLRGDMIQVFKIMNGLNDMNNVIFEMKDANLDLRGHKQRIQKPRARLDIRKGSFTHRVVDNWNLLPIAAVEAPTVNCFKSKFDGFFSKKYNKFTYGL